MRETDARSFDRRRFLQRAGAGFGMVARPTS